MKSRLIIGALVLGMTALVNAASIDQPLPNLGEIRVIPVDPTPEPRELGIRILYPKEGEMKDSTPIKGQVRIDGFPLGVDTETERTREIYNSKEGQSLHICIDNLPYFSINEALINALDDNQDYFDQTADFEIPFDLAPGPHTIRVMAARSFNECMKHNDGFAASTFYFKEKKANPQVDLTKPYLTYNEPQGDYSYRKNEPILLDFYISNCDLSQDGYKVKVTFDGKIERTLTSWQPFYVYGLSKGSHKIRLQLLSPDNKPVPGTFNDTERTIRLK